MKHLTEESLIVKGLCFPYPALNTQMCFLPQINPIAYSHDIDILNKNNGCAQLLDLANVIYKPPTITQFSQNTHLTPEHKICFSPDELKQLQKYHINYYPIPVTEVISNDE